MSTMELYEYPYCRYGTSRYQQEVPYPSRYQSTTSILNTVRAGGTSTLLYGIKGFAWVCPKKSLSTVLVLRWHIY